MNKLTIFQQKYFCLDDLSYVQVFQKSSKILIIYTCINFILKALHQSI